MPAWNRRFTDEQERQMAAEYAAGATCRTLSAKWGLSPPCVRRAIRRAGGTLRTAHERYLNNPTAYGVPRMFLAEEEAAIVREYVAGDRTAVIARRHACTLATVLNVVRRNGGKTRSLSEACRRHTLNEAAFDNAEQSEAASYFAGLLMADGCITNGNVIALGLSGEDRVQVFALREFLGSSHAVTQEDRADHDPPGQVSYKLSVASDRLVAALLRYGLTPRKSMTARIGGGMEKNPWFFRGLVDGDGFVSIPPSSGCPTVGLVGSRVTVEQFAAFVRSLTPTRANVSKMGNIWTFRAAGRHAVRVARALYEGAAVALPRKQAIAERIIRDFAYLEDRLPPRRPGLPELLSLKSKLGSWSAVATHLALPSLYGFPALAEK
jgi:hypothetical protein